MVATGIYPVVELGPSFQQYSTDVKASLDNIFDGIAAVYDLIDDIRINFLAPISSDVDAVTSIVLENNDGVLNAFRTLPLAPVGKLEGQSTLSVEGFEQCLPEEHVDSDGEEDGDQDFVDLMCSMNL